MSGVAKWRRLARAGAIAVLALGAVAPAPARANNEDGALVGADAVLTGGAVTATEAEGAALFYNVAGLAAVPEDAIDVTVTALTARIYRAPGLLRAPGGARSDAGMTELLTLPASATYVRRTGRHAAMSFGLFNPQRNDYSLEARLRPGASGPGAGSRGDGSDGEWSLVATETSSSLVAILGFGFEAAPGLRVGVSAAGGYRSAFGALSLAGGTTDRFETRAAVLSLTTVGLELGAGVQCELAPWLHLGLSVRTPALDVLQRLSLTDTRTSREPDGRTTFENRRADATSLDAFGLTSPLRARAGAAFVFRGGWVALDGGLSLGLDEAHATRRRPQWNVRFGGKIAVSDVVALGAGLYTDRSPYRGGRFGGEAPTDFYGLTAGVELGDRHRLAEGEEHETIALRTTIAARYAYGVGRIDAYTLGGGSAGGAVTGGAAGMTEPSALIVHELALSIASALVF